MQLPDVASEIKNKNINWVGMSEVQIPVVVEGQRCLAFVNSYVSLDQHSRGIHMSRLYQKMMDLLPQTELSGATLAKLLNDFVQSQEGLSSKAKIEIQFSFPLIRSSLLSGSQGWRFYPINITSIFDSQKNDLLSYVQVELAYSSTCPASAALARALVAEDFQKRAARFESPAQIVDYLKSPEGVGATPHAQRSSAWITWKLDQELALSSEIVSLEEAIQTPVQTLVKRLDEQEFARRNGQNLMFCEDAVRIFAEYLDRSKKESYHIRLSHFESLHAHNATAEIEKNWRSL